MPRRHKNGYPSQQPSSQSTDSQSSDTPTTRPTQSSQPTTQPKASSVVQTNIQSPSDELISRAKSLNSRTYEFNLKGPPNASLTDDDHDYECECRTKQIRSDLTSRPLIICGDARVVEITIKRNGDQVTNVEILMNRPLTSAEVASDLPVWLQNQIIPRVNEPIRDEFFVEQEACNDQSIARLMTTEYTTQGPPLPLKWTPLRYQMTVVIRSLVCLIDRQAEWEIFLRDLNQFVAQALVKRPIRDSAGQKAAQVILSNHERKLLITMKFARPCSSPTQAWIRSSSKDFFSLLTFARHAHHDNNPYDSSNNRSINKITEQMMAEIGNK